MIPLELKTQFGMEQYTILHEMNNREKTKGNATIFKAMLKQDLELLSMQLDYLLEDSKMIRKYPMPQRDLTTEGWRIQNEASDVIVCLNYFSNERV